MKTELELRQMFKNFSDCYVDTWKSERGFMEEGEVIQALTEKKFIEVMKQANFISSNPPVISSYCPKGCKGLCYTHDDRITQSCCECGETWAI